MILNLPIYCSTASSTTTPLGCRPSIVKRWCFGLGDPEWRDAVSPIVVAWCVGTASLGAFSARVPALDRAIPDRACECSEPEPREEPKPDPLLERAFNINRNASALTTSNDSLEISHMSLSNGRHA